MAEWFVSGRIAEAIIALTVLEAFVLALYRRITGRGVPVADLLPLLGAGIALMFALRAALTGQSWIWIALWLVVALAAHLGDLRRRWRN